MAMTVSQTEQAERTAQLREISGLEQEAARQVLEATGWRLEDAVALHFADGADEARDVQTRAVSQASASAAASASHSSWSGGVVPVNVPESHAVTTAIAGGSSDEDENPALVVTSPQESNGWLGSFGRTLTGLGQAVLGVASEDFDNWFLTRYGTPVPIFDKNSFSDAAKGALQDGRLLLLWFHQDESTATERLCREVLQNPIVVRLIRRNYTLWAGDVSRFEPGQIARLLNATIFPTLVVCQPLRNGFDSFGFCLEWPLGTFAQPLLRLSPSAVGEELNSDQAIVALTTAAEDHQQTLEMRDAQTAARTAQLAEERLLREEQDREFEASLLADQIAATQQNDVGSTAHVADNSSLHGGAADAGGAHDARPIEVNSQVPTPEVDSSVVEEAEEEEAKRKERGAEILAQLEPASAANSTAKLSLRLPSGERIQRVFLIEQKLEEVYEWAHCCRPCAKPRCFELCTTFPVRTLTEKSSTLGELALAPSAALVLKSAES